jgi:hypothetical protein
MKAINETQTSTLETRRRIESRELNSNPRQRRSHRGDCRNYLKLPIDSRTGVNMVARNGGFFLQASGFGVSSDLGFRISGFASACADLVAGGNRLFTPCTAAVSLLEAVTEAAKRTTPGDAVLPLSACSSFDQSRDDQQRGAHFAAQDKSTGRGAPNSDPKIAGENRAAAASRRWAQKRICPGFL